MVPRAYETYKKLRYVEPGAAGGVDGLDRAVFDDRGLARVVEVAARAILISRHHVVGLTDWHLRDCTKYHLCHICGGLGTAAGAGFGTVLLGALPAGSHWTVVVVLAVLGIATWLRPANYAYWAVAVTAVMALFLSGLAAGS